MQKRTVYLLQDDKDLENLTQAFANDANFNIVGADVVESAPDYDASGASTAVATKVIRELLMAM